jgi:hypothetical protein
MTDLLLENYNFSKIGKYISNKLHHLHKGKKEPHKSPASRTASQEEHVKPEKSENKSNRVRKMEWVEPSVGSYKVNYSAIDKYPSAK